MNRKAFGILILAACLFVVLAIVGQNQVGTGPIAGDSAGSRLLPGLADNLNNISQVTISGAGGQQLVGLERVDDQWTVSETGGYTAERSNVNALLIALAEARIVEEKTGNPALHSRLGVEAIADPDATGTEVSLNVADGDAFSIVLGDIYASGQRYARLAASDQSVLIDRNPDVARDPSDWVARDIVNIASDRVQRVEITQANGEKLVIRRDEPGTANFSVDEIPAGRELQYAGVANVSANLLQNLRLDEVRPASDDQTGPVVISEFWMFDGLVVKVTTTGVGDDAWLTVAARLETETALESEDSAQAEADGINGRVADWEYRIPPYQLSQLTRLREDLLKPPPTE